jgi:hypothetical protein
MRFATDQRANLVSLPARRSPTTPSQRVNDTVTIGVGQVKVERSELGRRQLSRFTCLAPQPDVATPWLVAGDRHRGESNGH